MSEKPILFSSPMVRAILAGQKTVTRRVVPPKSIACAERWTPQSVRNCIPCPYDTERLWVRETWGALSPYESDAPLRECRIYYRANTGNDAPGDWAAAPKGERPRNACWRPSIHMPRWASRITLAVESVRVERLHDITEEDARAEGADGGTCADCCVAGIGHPDPSCPECLSYRAAFWLLWQSINGKRPGCAWADNPWVWRVQFSRVTR
jgi:hypothetical protein